ncbi:uncharacterized protein LOC112452861 isoform X2 [Temnothorax curvispinosus]|uniref:Uncharacterized protein LOC112452861 isoform X2 n=1 Tax=Temnothorax curvispinosus TaxID=300111 RepID=A0A6J1PI39_9HYME|nr:uncharacterized protein LOC112452861 isoform X2 [Temnothorax curvispinosus]
MCLSINYIYLLYEFQFRRHFRLTKDTAYKLIEKYEQSSCPPLNNHGGIERKSPEEDVLVFLWFADDLDEEARSFEEIAGFPGVIGCIDEFQAKFTMPESLN